MFIYRKYYLWLILLYYFFISSCATYVPSSTPIATGGETIATTTENAASIIADNYRPGLATEWGETRNSPITTTQFTRANPTSPTATAMLYYNDEQGIAAMSSNYRSFNAIFPVDGNLASFSLNDKNGNSLSGLTTNGRNYVIGESGDRYSIVVRNNTANRLEAVLSVDGLDVLDGKPATFTKRGYLIDPYATLTVDGFRQSSQTVAAFRFGSVANSYANQKYGNTDNVGVIGLALFHEYGTYPTDKEIQQRHSADPFPNRFATPP